MTNTNTNTADLRAALALAEAALSDIGDADREPGDDLAWCEARAAKDLPTIRAALGAPAQAVPANEALKNAALPWPWKTDAEVLDDAISAIEGQNRLKAALRSIAARTTPAAAPAQAGEYQELPDGLVGAIMLAAYDFRDALLSGSKNIKRHAHAELEATVIAALRAAHGAAQAAPVVAADAGRLWVECRECDACGHIGINDSSSTLAACRACNWSGDSPTEDHCPGCEEDGTMTSACPKCDSRYNLLADAELFIDAARAQEQQP